MNNHINLARAVRAAASLIAFASAASAGSAFAAETGSSPTASPQASSQLEEIVVSVRRREENSQDVPIALSIVNADALKATGAYTLNEIQRLVPSLQVFSSNARNTTVNIRGLGSNLAASNDGLENGVGFYVDNVYYGRFGQTQFDLVDLQQVEVLRGPQGTLFGRNTTAGAINVTTQKPSFTPEYFGELTAGDYGRGEVRASATGPISDDLAAYRVTFAQTQRDGYIDNEYNGHDVSDYENSSLRGQLLLTPTDAISLRLIGDYSAQDTECCVQPLDSVFTTYSDGTPIANNFYDRVGRAGYTPVVGNPFDREIDADAPFQADMNTYGASGQLDWQLDGGTLTSISAYRGWDWRPKNDVDATSLSVFTAAQQENEQRQASQELRFTSPEGELFDYVVGAYYLWQRNEGTGETSYGADAANWFLPQVPAAVGNLALNGFGSASESVPEIDSYAVFGQTVWHLAERLDLTAGLRWSRDEKTGEFETNWATGADLSQQPPALADAARKIRTSFTPEHVAYETGLNDDSVSGLLSLSYGLNDTTLTYATVSTGSKSGGLNLTTLPAGVDPVVEPEDVLNYELGVKAELPEARLTLNTALFSTEISDYQTAVLEVLPTTTSFVQYIANSGEVRSRGVESDLVFQATDNIGLYASVAYTDATYQDYTNAQQKVEDQNLGLVQDLSGEPLAGAPEWTYTVGLNASQPVTIASRPLEVYGSTNYSWRSEYFTAISNSAYSEVEAYGLLQARVGVRTQDQRWDLSLWAKNLADEEYFQQISPAATGLVSGVVGEPRTVGATLRATF